MFRESLQPNILPWGRPAGPSLRMWVLLVATGVGAGLAGGLLMKLLRAVQHFCWSYHGGAFLNAVQHAATPRRIAVLVAAGILAAAIRYLLKQTTGGNSAELTARIWFGKGDLPPLRTATNAVLSIVLVGAGESLGREAAPKQAGALVASLLGSWAALSPSERRLLAACGAGAGMAAVYNVPFGGAAFALEVLLGTLSLSVVAPALATSLIATAVSWLLLPNRPTYTLPSYHVTLALVIWALIAGPLIGLAAVGYIRAIAWADARKPKGPGLLVMPVIVFTLLGCLAIQFPQLLGNGKDVVQQAVLGQIGLKLLVCLFLLKPLMTAACLGSGAPGGLFTPTMTYGALLGGLLGRLWAFSGASAAAGSCALVGATAMLAAAMQAPVSALILTMELTRHLDPVMVPTLLAVAGALATTRRLESRSIYSGRVHAARVLTGQARAASSPGQGIVSAAAHYPELLHAVLTHGDGPQPLRVLGEHGEIIGAVSRDSVVHPDPALIPLEAAAAMDFAKPASGRT